MLKVDQLCAGYGKLTILHDISLVVEPGQFVAVLGPNGSGKSTLLKSVFGLADRFTGEIRLGEVSLGGLPTETVSRHGIAYVPQRENVFPSLSVQENLRLAVRKQNPKAAEMGLQRAYETFPILHGRLRQRAGALSGGERQMLAIAIGWLAEPRIMLLDEPSAGLSPLLVTEVFRTLKALAAGGLTLVVVEQNARSILHWCDYAYLFREGHIVLHGSAATLLADEETVKSYLGVHTRKQVQTGSQGVDTPPP